MRVDATIVEVQEVQERCLMKMSALLTSYLGCSRTFDFQQKTIDNDEIN